MVRRPRVGISAGDPSGIGPEIIQKALADPRVRRALEPVVFGDASFAGAVQVSQLPTSQRAPGKPSRTGGRAQLAYVEAAIAAAKRGEVDSLCTAPVSKEQITRAGVRFMGHTELLAAAFDCEVLMLMDGPRVSVALATNHLPLADVPKAIRAPRLVRQLRLLARSFGKNGRIGVCGLNPHAGEGGLLGQEELRQIVPAIARAQRLGIRCEGPLAADGLFARAEAMPYDVVLAMYHDQGLVAAKALDFDRTVNVTLGLPLPRTSPDHGVAYDIAGKGRANAEPMIAALLKAAELTTKRHR